METEFLTLSLFPSLPPSLPSPSSHLLQLRATGRKSCLPSHAPPTPTRPRLLRNHAPLSSSAVVVTPPTSQPLHQIKSTSPAPSPQNGPTDSNIVTSAIVSSPPIPITQGAEPIVGGFAPILGPPAPPYSSVSEGGQSNAAAIAAGGKVTTQPVPFSSVYTL